MLLFEVLLVGDDGFDGQYGTTELPDWLDIVVDVGGRDRVAPVIVWDGPDHTLETHRMDFNIEVRLASSLNLHDNHVQ